MNPDELRVYQQSLDSIPFHETLGVELVQLEPTVQLKLTASDALRSLGSALHGGAIAALVDIAVGVEAGTKASNYNFAEDGLVTLDMHLRYLAQPRTKTVTAEARMGQQAGEIIRLECVVTDEGGRVVAQASVISLIRRGRHRLAGVQLTDKMQAASALHPDTPADQPLFQQATDA